MLPLGDPGLPLGEALDTVRRWYGERGLPAYVQTATGAEGTQERLCADLEEHGWRREVTADVRVASLAPIGDLDRDVSAVRTSRKADATWLSRYQRFDTPGPHVLKVLGSGPSVWFASVPGDDPAGCPPRSDAAWWTAAGPASWPSRWVRSTGGAASRRRS